MEFRQEWMNLPKRLGVPFRGRVQESMYLLWIRFRFTDPKALKLGSNNDTDYLGPGKNTALHLAARMGDKRVVEELLNLKRSLLTEKNIKRDTPLHLAASSGHVDVVESLIHHANMLGLENGVHELLNLKISLLTEKNIKGNTPLHLAASSGHVDVVESLIHHANMLDLENGGVHELLNLKISLLTEKNIKGNTPLHLAASSGHVDVVQSLIHHANMLDLENEGVHELLNLKISLLTEKNIKGNTPLHLAASSDHVDVVESLIDHANMLDVENGGVLHEVISIKNMKGNMPLHEAVRNVRYSVTALLVDEVSRANHRDLLAIVNEAGESPLSMAIDVKHYGIRKKILRENPSLLHRGPNGQTLLHRAILRADIGTIIFLVEKRRELIYEKDSYGRTPLHYAAASGVRLTVYYLLKVDPSIALLQDHYLATPAHLAAENGMNVSLSMVLNRCPDSVELLNQHSQNILHVAAQNGSIDVVNDILSLLEVDDLINEPDKDGNTPLHLAAMNFHSSVVYGLTLTGKLDIRAINNDGKTALDIAQDYKRNMTDKKSLFKVCQLKEDNFINWRIQMKTLLDSKDVWEVTEKGYEVPADERNLSQTQRDHINDARKKDKQAFSFIYQAIDENTFEKISGANTAKEAWEILEDCYKRVDKPLSQEKAVDASYDENDNDPIKENQVIIEILKEEYAKKAENLKDIRTKRKYPLTQIKDWKRHKELSGALMVMAILIATVTFAAGFTIPGGFQSGNSHAGMAVLGKNTAFRAFIITDTIAMTSSMMAALILIITPLWTHKEISELLFQGSIILLWIALMTMGLAFVTGLYAVLSDWLPLAIAVCSIGCLFPCLVYAFGSLTRNDSSISTFTYMLNVT